MCMCAVLVLIRVLANFLIQEPVYHGQTNDPKPMANSRASDGASRLDEEDLWVVAAGSAIAGAKLEPQAILATLTAGRYVFEIGNV